MPACFQLIPKGSTEPKTLQEIDEEMCKHFKQPCDKVKYLNGWVDSVGLGLAVGRTFEEILTIYKEEKLESLILITEYLRDRYEVSAFYSPV